MLFAAFVVAILSLSYSECHHAPSAYPSIFGAISHTSAITLSVSVPAAMQKRPHWITFWRISFHASFGIAMASSALLVLQGQLAGMVSRHYDHVES